MEPDADDPVERNRSADPRRTPERNQVGGNLLPKLYAATAAAIVVATIVLIVALTT